MPTTYYYSVNGNLIGEATGGVETTYVPDGLGSTTQTITSAGLQNRYVYSPYGRLITRSGPAVDPKFLWNGRTQSRTTGGVYAEQYNRRRHYSSITTLWTTRDQIWPFEDAYNFASRKPTTNPDPSGMAGAGGGKNWLDCPPNLGAQDAWQRLHTTMKGLCPDPDDPPVEIVACWAKCGDSDPYKEASCFCKHGRGDDGYGVTFQCYSNPNMCDATSSGLGGSNFGSCMGTDKGGTSSNCEVRICPKNCPPGLHWQGALFHEMMHCCGALHPKPGQSTSPRANMDCLEDCLRHVAGWPTTKQGWPGWPSGMDTQGSGACNESAYA